MKNKQTARKTIDAEKFNEMMEMVHTEHHRLKEVIEELVTQNKELNSLVDDQQEHFVNIAVRLGKYKGENEGFKRKIQKLEKENECLKEDMVRLEKENDKLKEKYKYSSDTCSHYSHYHEFVMDCSNRENDFEEWLKENCMEINDDGEIVQVHFKDSDDEE